MPLETMEIFKRLQSNGSCIELTPSDVKALQQVLKTILKDLIDICSAVNANWCVCGGTCLGATRHHGFIPWDDDLDVFMLRQDFKSFEREVETNWCDKYSLHSPQLTRNYGLGLSRLILKGTKQTGQNDFSDGTGVFCDIFILENTSNNSVVRRLHGIGSLGLGLVQSCTRFYEHKGFYVQVATGNALAEKAVRQKTTIGKAFRFRSNDEWTQAWDRWNSHCRNNSSQYISCPAGRKHYFGELYRRDDFFPVSYGEFEGLRVPLPANPDAYLTALYGPDYMTPPVEADRETHVVLEFDLGKYDPRNQDRKDVE